MRSFNSPDFGYMVESTAVIGTGLTNLFTVPVQEVGDFYWTAQLWVVQVGAGTCTVTPGYTGSASPIGWACERYTTVSVAVSLHSSFQATAGSSFVVAKLNGFFRASTTGNFTIGSTRSGGTSSTLQIASHVEMYKVE
jgi:hypothetical protein